MHPRLTFLRNQAYEIVSDEAKQRGCLLAAQAHNDRVDEVFAELIVKECSAVAWFTEQFDIGDKIPISKQLYTHFGVQAD